MLKATSLQRAQGFLKSFVINEERMTKVGLPMFHFIRKE